ncbi:unnamed protein product [Heligmosomoides polygyrus]|uniref:Uncharacterized protein n=1 Tax=Heligmosomoides polygyrus TaxID=6339 RepID=A0A3P8BVV0_HELPZ|nr:unnamed protein product [Heligmosomoides polygyrus]
MSKCRGIHSPSRSKVPNHISAAKFQASRRRPPLNRSIPPIPESKSNESIMSHASRRSSDKVPSGCVVIENRNALEQLQRLPKSANSVVSALPRPSRTKKLTEQKREEKSSRTETPRSPLMTVARTVKNKFSKLTRMGRHEQDVSMKGSQSFSGIRQPKSAMPKRIDQNANRVIKSSSMEVPSTSQEPTTSKHMVRSLKPTEPQPEIRHQELSVTLDEDVLMVTKQLDDFADPRPSVSFEASEVVQRPSTYTCAREHRTFALGEKIPDTSSMLRAPEPSVDGERREEKVVMTREGSPPPRFLMSVKTPEAMRKHQTFVVGLAECEATLAATPIISSPKKKKKAKIIKQRSMPERTVSPDRYILKVKTPEALRRHHTFTIRERARSPDVPYIEDGEITEPIATVGPSAEKLKKQEEDTEKRLAEEEPVQEKYTMSVRTPFTLRKFNTFVVEEKPREEVVPCSKIADTLVHAKVTEDVASPSPSEKQQAPETALVEDSHEKFILTTTSTPATMRKFQTFVIEDRQQKTQPMKSHTSDNVEAIARLGGQEEESEHVPLKTSDMYVLTTMTPLPQRKGTHLERIAKEKSRSASRSPDKVSLFVLGGRTAPRGLQNEDITSKCAAVQPQIDLDTPRREGSQSDKAEFVERKNSASSGEMTSPEEEIPMDTHLTPTEEVHHDEMLITRAIRRPAAEVTSPIAEESETSVGDALSSAFFEHPPSEEFKAITLSKSTSPLRRRGSTECPRTYDGFQPVPIPSPMPMSKTRMHLPFRSGLVAADCLLRFSCPTYSFICRRKAPLAEFESSVVEDSPAVENNPLTFEKWSNSPRGKRRSANPLPVGEADQPMLVGDTFSHSDSNDCLSAAEKATLISIDRSLIEDSDSLEEFSGVRLRGKNEYRCKNLHLRSSRKIKDKRIKDGVIQSPLGCATHSPSTGCRGGELNAYLAIQ